MNRSLRKIVELCAGACFALAVVLVGTAVADEAKPEPAQNTISFYKDIRPILQANCHGCHQPAKAKGEYVMTSFDRLLSGGESGDPVIVAGKPDESTLVEYITPVDGSAEMPKDAKPLAAVDIDKIRRWIAEGAVNDTPESAKQRYDMDNPPVYLRPPVIASLDYSPDGQLLAVAGFHEVLLMKPDGSQRVGRLVGVSERIQSVRFSPDGARLAVTGGLPARMGEVQIWDVATKELLLSVSLTYDTVYGARWSPDGKVVSVGCADQTVRAIDAKSGEQVFFSGAHDDWALDTVFSTGGDHLISVGRDMTTKLYQFTEQRFVDNITSITPGALKGGILTVARHPQRDEIVIGGSDGIPKVYRIFRKTNRVIGDDANVIRVLPAMKGRVNSVAVSQDGSLIAAGSSLDGAGQIHVYAYDFDGTLPDDVKKIMEKTVSARSAAENKRIEEYKTKDTKLIAKTDLPETAIYAVGFHPDGKTVAAAGTDGLVRLIDTQTGEITKSFLAAPVDSSKTEVAEQKSANINFIRDVNPVMSRLGCNQGTCHGSRDGQNGFKLSLRGYDAVFDVRALLDDHGARRVNFASPDDSLMLLKASGAVPHEGGQLVQRDDPYYRLIRGWIAGSARLDLDTPRVTSIEVTPKNPVLQKPGQRQSLKVVATYADGATRDVTQETFLTSGDAEVATAEERGTLVAIRRGEAPVLARYVGAYAATTLTVMGDREEFQWEQPPVWGRIDELVADKWKRMKILPSELTADAEFVRRVFLDLQGLPPTPEEVQAFLDDPRDSQVKRDELVDHLVGSDGFVEYWTNKWADLLQVNSKFLGKQGAVAFRDWIRKEVQNNTPYDDFARSILTADGSNRENPAASYYKVLREPVDIMENTTHLFLAIRFNCNKCHDHPFERWTQDQYYTTAAYFAQVDLKPDPASGKRTIGGTAVEGAKPLYELVLDKQEGDVVHDRTKAIAPPQFPFEAHHEVGENATRRQQMAAWITSDDNPYFARSYVNRLWGYLFGVGIIEPIDDIRAGNPPTNPELLDYLTKEFVDSGFNVQRMFSLICKSRTYQLSFLANRWNEDDRRNYSHALPRRLPAEVLYDALHQVTGSISDLPGVPPGTRAAALPDSNIKLPGGFLDTMGRPARQSACECERSSGLELGPVMALISGPTVAAAIADPKNSLIGLVEQHSDDTDLVNAIVMRILNRPASQELVDATMHEFAAIDRDHARLAAALDQLEAKWAPMLGEKETARQQAINDAQVELARYEKEKAADWAAQEQLRNEQIAETTAVLQQYEKDLPEKFVTWEASQDDGVQWHTVDVVSADSSEGATLTVLEDGSVLASGDNPETDTRTVVARSTLDRVTAIRLEALTHESLPNKGPGRRDDGNFLLSKFTATLGGDAPADPQPIELVDPWATFSQQYFPVAKSLQETINVEAGWAIKPALGTNHMAFFKLKEPLTGVRGREIVFGFEHQYPGQRVTLGRFRVSLTDAAPDALAGPEINLTPWQHVGPFMASERREAYEFAFPPEKVVDLKETFEEGKLKWQEKPEFKDGQRHLVFEGRYAVDYLYRQITVPVGVKLPISLGADDMLKVFLNGKEVLGKNVTSGLNADDYLPTLDLAPGVNHLLLKIANVAGPGGFYFRADKDKASVPAEVLAVLHTAREHRSEQQRAELMKYYRNLDKDLQQRLMAVAKAKRPVPEDPGRAQRKRRIEEVSVPVPLDAKLVALRFDVKTSEEQRRNKRLTIAQDLVWVLINSPAFLFNH